MPDDGINRTPYLESKKNGPGRPPGVKNGNGKRGRPTSFDPKIHIPTAYHLALMGATEDIILKACGCSVPTFYKWKKDHPEFLKALNVAKVPIDHKVTRRLL